MSTIIIDYGSGNLRSAAKAFERMSSETGAGPVAISADPDAIRRAERIVLPGVGAFHDCRAGLMAIDGLFEAIEERVHDGYPILGICVGMQMMASWGYENGKTPGFDWIHGEVCRIEPNDPELKVPHMGWNELSVGGGHPVLKGIASGDHVYFVHSYHFRVRNPEQRLAHTAHGEMIAAVIGRGNVIGTQFHPEKSQKTGLRLISNFLAWKP